MSLRPVAFHSDGSVDVIHDDAPNGVHAGTVAPANVGFQPQLGGGHDHRYVVLTCPVAGCPTPVQVHPIAGGAASAEVQALFVRLAARVGCPCGQFAAGTSLTIAQSHIKLQVQRMDGSARWAIVGQLS